MKIYGGTSDWEPDYDNGSGVYATRHNPPMWVWAAEDEDGYRTALSGCYETREEAEREFAAHEERHLRYWQGRADAFQTEAAPDGRILVTPDFGYWSIGDRKTGAFRGMGGRTFQIRLFAGPVVESSDMWSGGTIPARYQSLFEPNGEFVNGERWVDLGSMKAFG